MDLIEEKLTSYENKDMKIEQNFAQNMECRFDQKIFENSTRTFEITLQKSFKKNNREDLNKNFLSKM